MNRRRLEAEALRDNVLAVAGTLNLETGGPAARDFASPRRTVYLMTIRSDRSGFGPLFDAADPTSSVEKRTVSTVAPQALFLLNSAFVMNQSKALAKRILATPAVDQTRIVNLYDILYSRAPSTAEMLIGESFLRTSRSHAAGSTIPVRLAASSLPSGSAESMEESAWQQYCQILLCANEFMYVD